MTGPADPAPTDQPPTLPATSWIPPTPSADPAAPPPVANDPGWVPPSGDPSRVRTGCIIGCLVLALLIAAGVVGLIFVGGQIFDMVRGSVQFGTGGTECQITGVRSTFTSSETVHIVAIFERPAGPNETADLLVTYPDGTSETHPQTFAEATTCLYLDAGPELEPGSYALELRIGPEVLAKGAMTVTP